MSNFKDLTGQKFGRLTVLSRLKDDKRKEALWLCKCDCGKLVKVYSYTLRIGRTKSCGCWKRDNSKKMFSTHKLSNTRVYKIWAQMKKRCYNPNYSQFELYGGRGISMCNEWKENFLSFYNWSMANGYNDKLSIDRIDFNGNYEPNNCKWSTNIEQANNKRNNHFITYNNETHTIAEWERKLGLYKGAVGSRLSRGWSIEKTLTTSIGNRV